MNFKSFLLLLALSSLSFSLSAQDDRPTEDDARRDLDYYNQDRTPADNGGGGLWYGGGFQLGFSSNSFQSIFNIGISPMVGYKITPWLSAGPRASILYNAYRFDTGGGTRESTNFFTYAGGVFARGKVVQQFFLHAEYNLENDVVSLDNNLDPIRRTRGVPYLGAGYVQGGGFQGGVGFELMILFPLKRSEFLNDPPYILRSGITVNF